MFGEGHEASKYYKMLLECVENKTAVALKSAWERDLNVSFDEHEWEEICSNSRIMSRDLRVRLM